MVAIILVILAIPAVWQLIIPGHFQPHDLHHLADIHQMTQALTSMQLPPRWAPGFTHGFGYPLFNFYYVLPFYIGSGFYSLIGSLTESLKLVFLTCFAVSVWGMYKFLREFSSKWASVVGVVIFTYTPYRAVQIYVRGAVGEALSLALLPATAYFLVRLVKKPNPKNTALASIWLALSLSAHNYMWFLSLPFVYILLLLIVEWKKLIQSIKSLVLASILGLGAVSYWIFPAVLELKHVPRLTPFLLEDHFPFMKQLIYSPWGYGASNWGPYDDLSFQIGIINLIVMGLLGLIFLLRFNRLKREKLLLIFWVLASFAISLIFMNIRTLPIWKLLPIYNFVQFPWRLLYLTAFFSSIAGALVIDLLPSKLNKKLALLLIFLSIFLTRNYFKPSSRFHYSDKHYFELFYSDPNYSEDYLLLTEWAEERPDFKPSTKMSLKNGQVISENEKTAVNWEFEVLAEEEARASFNSYYFPGWFAKIDGQLVDIVPGEKYGQITFDVPPGEHKIEVYWAETRLRLFFDLISLASIVYVLYLYFKKNK